MRNLVLAFVFLAAALFIGCPGPYDVARREVDRVTTTVRDVHSGLKATTKAALDKVVETEKAKRVEALKAAGCPTDKAPATPIDPALAKCQTIWDEAMASYLKASRDVAAKAAKVDASIAPLYDTLLLAVQVIGEVEKGLKPKASMTEIVGRLTPLLATCKAAYAEWKLFAAQYTPLPGWLP